MPGDADVGGWGERMVYILETCSHGYELGFTVVSSNSYSRREGSLGCSSRFGAPLSGFLCYLYHEKAGKMATQLGSLGKRLS